MVQSPRIARALTLVLGALTFCACVLKPVRALDSGAPDAAMSGDVCIVDPADVLDFGAVAIGPGLVASATIRNAGALPVELSLGTIQGADAEAFTLLSIGPGLHTIAPGGALSIPVQFKPGRLGAHTALLELGSSGCTVAALPLAGTGVDQVLVNDPTTLDFGFVSASSRLVMPITFSNLSKRSIRVSDLRVTAPAGQGGSFGLVGPDTSFILPAHGSRIVEVVFTPGLVGAHTGNLQFVSDDAKRGSGSIALVGFGGGADIDVQPRSLDFGLLPVSGFRKLSVRIVNRGTDEPGTTLDNLLLAQRDASGQLIERRGELVGAFANEFSLEWPPVGYGPQGIAAGSSVELIVKFSPISAGAKQATLRIFSTDPDEPIVEVALAGIAKDAPPCDYEIRPTALGFGLVEPPKFSQRSFFIVNKAAKGQDECLISTLDLVEDNVTGSAKRAFTLVKGAITSAIIKGGEAFEIPVRFQPSAVGRTYTGRVEFYISSTTKPEGKVELTGSSQQGCLMIAPADFDFGVIGVNCSRERPFTVYNICTSNVTLSAIDIQAGYSTEFTISQKPALPKTLAPGEQLEFKARYRPTNIGEGTGTIAIKTVQLTMPYVVTVSGRGATDAVQTDVFAQSSQPKVDVLLIVDNTSSMSDKQDSLGRNFNSFIKYAIDQQVDYHIAVTTTGVDKWHGGGADNGSPPDENGLFVPVNQWRPTIITPNTPNPEQVFAQNVKVGTSGNDTELLIRPGYLALSPPNINAVQNANFLRDEATLAVVTVSNADDQDPVPVSFYQNFFLNIKGLRRANAFSYSGIIPTLPSPPGGGCAYDSNSAGNSMRTRSLVTATGGVYDEICTPDWAKTLEKVGQIAFGYRTRFFLSNLPDMSRADPIEVKRDGAPYPQHGPFGEVRWRYNSTVNAIDFDALSAPEPGTTLEITYHVECLTH